MGFSRRSHVGQVQHFNACQFSHIASIGFQLKDMIQLIELASITIDRTNPPGGPMAFELKSNETALPLRKEN